MYLESGLNMSATEITVAAGAIVAAYIALSYYRLGRAIDTAIFAALVVLVLVAVKMGKTTANAARLAKTRASSKEPFFFEAAPYRKCSGGFYGRPLQFEYSLTEPTMQCNPF